MRKILEDRYTMGSLIGSQCGNEFFGQWSQIVCEGRKKDKYFPNRIRVLEGFGKGLEVDVESKAFREVDGKQVPMHVEPGRRIMDISFVPEEYGEAYRPLLQNRRFLGLFNLLGDEDLGELMQVQYPPEAAEIAAVVGTSKDADIIREAIARQVGKKPDELNDKDYSKIRQLILEGSDISDLEPIKGLGSLQRLDLRGTQVSNLQSLKDLINLRALDLRETQATTLEPIGDLNNLQRLYLTDTQVNDLSPLKALANLQRLYIGRTQVRTLEPLKALTNLQALDLTDCTQVSSIKPLKTLTDLQTLDLRGTQVSSIEPLRALANLQELDLRSTHVTDEAVQALQKSLPNLRITR